MKGFIEVTDDYGRKVTIGIRYIEKFIYSKEQKETHIYTENFTHRVKETYEEIRQKIKEATDPRLMIDEKGNLKEQR